MSTVMQTRATVAVEGDKEAALAAAASQSLVQNVGLKVIRDRIELTHAYVEGLQLSKNVTPGSTLLFIAREIVVNAPSDFLSGVSFGNYKLFFIADSIDLRHGVWVQNDTVAAQNEVGAPGPSVKILCRQLLGASVFSIGGTGGKGLRGETGVVHRECIQSTEPPFDKPHCWWEVDKAPGRGKKGAKGGNGGYVLIDYVHDLVPGGFQGTSILSAGGPGGEGGEGGLSGIPGNNTTVGNKGPDGDPGDPTAPFVGPVVESYYNNEVRGWLGADFDVWLQHRFQAADYYFRAFRPNGSTSHYLNLARDEANAIVALAPGSEEWAKRAASLRDNILNNLNVLGLPRDYTLQTPPEFPRLNERLYKYEEPVNNFFRNATNGLLLADLTETGVLGLLGVEKGRLADPLLAKQLLAETQAAGADKTAAATNLSTANTRIEQLKKEIDDLEFKISTELPASDLKLSNGLTLAAGTVLVMAATMFAPPAAGAAAAALMPLAADLLGNSGMSGDIKTIFNGTQDISKALQEKADDTKKNAKGLNEFSKDYGKDQEKAEKDWKDPALKIAFSFAKITKNLIDIANIKDPREVELVKKYQELMAATHQQFLAQLGSSAAEFRHTAALAAEHLRVNDLDRVNQAIATVTGAQHDMRNGVVSAVRNARAIRHQLLLRVFEASRALDLYTLSYAPAGIAPISSPYVDLNNPVSLVAYDYGYLHPDVEEDYIAERITHTKFKSLLDGKMQTIESMGYDDAFEAYKRRADGMVGGVFTFPLNADALKAAVEAFLETKRFRFFVKIDVADIWGLRHEVKVTDLTLRLDGVRVRAPFSCKVWHYGRSQQRALPSDNRTPPVVEQLLPLSNDFITMRIAEDAPTTPGALTSFEGSAEVIDPADGRVKMRSWGRGVAAEWMVEIEPGTGEVDLSKLTDVTLSIDYDSFEEDPTPGTPALRSVQHAVGTIQPGTTAHAAVALTAPAPPNGLAIKLTTSNAAAVKVPGGVMVPAGAMAATIPMEIPATAAGQSATITATGDFTIRTTVRVPAQTMETVELTKTAMPGYLEAVNAVAADDTYVYATHHLAKTENTHESLAEGELIRIRLADFKEQLPRVKLGFQPRSIAINPNPAVNCIYVVNYGQESYSLSILDRGTLKEVAASPLKLGQGPIDVAVNTRTNRVYVTNWSQRKIHVIAVVDPAPRAHAVVAEIKAAPGAEPLTGLHGLAIDQVKDRIYAARNYHSGGTPDADAVEVIDGKTNTVVRTITHPDVFQAIDVAIDAAGRRLYVATLWNPNHPASVVVFDINPATGSASYRMTIPTNWNPSAIAVNHQRNQIYVPTQGGVGVIDGKTLTTVATIPTGTSGQSVAISPAADRYFVGDGREGTLTRLSVPDLGTIESWT